MKPTIKHYYNGSSQKFEVNTLPSMTVPDMSMTIAEIIARTQKGLPVTGVRVPIYNETDEGIMPDLRNMDLSEVAELKRKMQKAEKEALKKLEELKQEQLTKEREEFYKKKFAKEDKPVITEAEEVK